MLLASKGNSQERAEMRMPNEVEVEVESQMQRVNRRAVGYVETSLDDLVYSDSGEASGPSEDEENERQLIEKLKQENHRRQLRQIEQQQQQQQLARQQQQAQQTAQVVCFHEATTTTVKSAIEPNGPSSTFEDGAPPQVPVRRSSRQAASALRKPSDQRVDSFCNDAARTRAQVGNQHDDDDGRDQDNLSDDDSLLPPPPRLHAMSAGVLAGRPPLPPPPPPQLHEHHPPIRPMTHQMVVTGKRTKPLLPPPPPPRTRSCQHAPKNIWSPSSSSVLSSSSPSSSSPMTSEPDLESEQQQQLALRAPAQRMEIPLRNGDQTDGSGQPMSSDDLERSLTNEDQDQATVVERHLGELAQSSLASGNAFGLAGPGERSAVAIAALTTATSNANGATSETTLMEPQGNKMGVADGSDFVDGDGDDDDGGGRRAAPINKELQAASRKVRSFSVATPNNPMSEKQQQQRQVNETTGGNLVSDQMRRAGGGGSSRGGLSSFVGSGQARSFSIATTTLQQPLLPSSSVRGQQVAGLQRDKLVGEAGKLEECHSGRGAFLPDARNAAGQTGEELESDELTFSQQKQQQLERGEQQSAARPVAHSQQQLQQARGLKPPSYAGTVSTAYEASDGLDGWPQAPTDERCELSASRTADDRVLPVGSADQQTKAQQQQPRGASKAGPSGQVFAMESESDERDQLGDKFGRLNSTRDECYKRQLIERRTITTTTTTKTKLAAAGVSRPDEHESSDGAFNETKLEEVAASEFENEPFSKMTKQNQSGKCESQQQKAQSKEDWFKSMYKQMHKSNGASAERGLLDAVNSQQNRQNDPATSLIKIKLKSPRSEHRLDPSYFSEEDLERRSTSPVFNNQKPGNICDYLPGQSSISQHERNLLLYHKLIEHINRVFSSVLQQTGDGGAATSRSTNALHATCGHQQRSRATNLPVGLSAPRPRSHSMRRSRRRLSSGGGGGIKRHKAQQSASGPQTPANSGNRQQDADSSWGLPAARTYHVRSTRLKDLAVTTSSDNLPQDSQHKRRCVFERLAIGFGDNQDACAEQDIYHKHHHHRVGQHASNSLDRSSRFATGNQQLDYTTLGEVEPDPRRQYVAVQQGRDIPLKGLRKPAPQPNIYKGRMFDDKSINIHYKTPTSRLLKMNTLNEFELNRIKKFYAQELLNRRLTRSKSTRLTRNQQQQQLGQSDTCWGVPPPPLLADTMPAETALVVDPKRYQHALGRKSLRQLQQTTSHEQSSGTIRFARALYDFAAKNDNELAMRRGDLVEILGLLEGTSGWVRVEDCQSGLQGLVPIDYLDHRIGCAVAKRDVNSRPDSRIAEESQLHLNTESPPVSGEQLLPMNRGEPIVLIRRLSGHLYEASNTRQAVGLVWSNDVDIIKQPPASGQTVDEHQQKVQANYEAPTGNSNYRDEAEDYLTDEDEELEDDDLADEDLEIDRQDEEELTRCLRSICHELKPVSARGRREIPLLCSELARRRRARSASGALNEAYTTTTASRATRQQQAVASERQQQYCTMSRRQQQQVAASCCSARIQDRHCCNCRHEQRNEYQTRPSMLLRRPPRSSSSPQIWPQSEGPQNDEHLNEPGTSSKETPRLYRARFAYEPRQSDELELAVGDILVVAQECDDGWLIGSSYTTKQTGTFPGNFVERI